MYSVKTTMSYDNDLDLVISYIVCNLSAPAAATNLLDEIVNHYSYLETDPYMFSKCISPKLERDGYRRIVIKNYILLYKIDKETNIVMIHRLFHGSQNYEDLI